MAVFPSPRVWGFAMLAASVTLPLAVMTATPAQAADKTSTTEARRVDRVKTPRITWVEDEANGGYTGSVKVPLDYDKPTGSTVKIALFKVPAADPAHKIGTLFLNPGGPGGSGVDMAEGATSFLSQSVLDRFDIVGFDPRGTNRSTTVNCFSSTTKQAVALSGLGGSFPTSTQQSAFISAAAKLASACSKYGVKLASAMSTAEVARDMDVLRRAVGDKKLNFLGFSYGSYLGEVYANLFPDRFRSIAIDGVVDPVAWAGTTVTNSVPASIRGKAGEASWNALVAGLKACAEAPEGYCPLSDPQADFDAVAAKLKTKSLHIGDDATGYDYSYTDLISDVHTLLYYPEGMDYVAQVVAALKQMIDDGTETTTGSEASEQAASLVRAFHRKLASYEVGYDNSLEAYSGVLCTDAYQPSSANSWVLATTKSNSRAPHFGQLWGWSDVQCATSSWKAKDEDAYHGTYSRTTVAPVLIVGNYHDPATNYAGAVQASVLMPNSVLLRSDSWGHTAYGTSDCVTDTVDTYLLTGAIPAGTAETVCTGDVQPFTVDPDGSEPPSSTDDDDTTTAEKKKTSSSSRSTTSSTTTSDSSADTVSVPTRKGLPPVTLPLPSTHR
ncbi:MAG: alpha/beta hydrolase [Actinobacteria bacterium]|nr:alpha/beta hydrolase [Actinomycetota bacterium]